MFIFQVAAAQTGAKSAAKYSGVSAAVPLELNLNAIQARIAVVSARTDLAAQERDLVLKQLNAAFTVVEAAGAARNSAAEFAATLQTAQQTIAGLKAESLSGPAEFQLDLADDDPVRMQLKLASLQTQAVSLRSRNRGLEESLQNMASRPEQARAELVELRRQLNQPPAAIPGTAS